MTKTTTQKPIAKTPKVSTMAGARKALLSAEQMTDKAESLMRQYGITDLLADASALKKQATEWAIEKDIDRIDMEDGRYYGLRRDVYNKQIIGDENDLNDLKDPQGVIPLKTILKRKFGKQTVKGKVMKFKWFAVWQQVTSRKVDVDKLQMAVTDGTLTLDEIQAAYYQETKSPYLRRY
jgi:hypothetical protein